MSLNKFFRWTYNTPPDSPRCPGQHNDVSQELDIYALQGLEGNKLCEYALQSDGLTQLVKCQ